MSSLNGFNHGCDPGSPQALPTGEHPAISGSAFDHRGCCNLCRVDYAEDAEEKPRRLDRCSALGRTGLLPSRWLGELYYAPSCLCKTRPYCANFGSEIISCP